jgi:hypothetical protein
MKQVYINFGQSDFEGKRNKYNELEGINEKSLNISRSNVCFQIPIQNLPQLALEYYNLVKKKGFTATKGSPVLHVIENKVTEVKENSRETRFNLIARWPSNCGHLQKSQENKGVVGLTLTYSTEPVCFDEFQKLKENAKLEDLWTKTDSQYDLFKLIKDAPWRTQVILSLERKSHDSTLPISFLSEINNKHAQFKGMIPNPKRRVGLDEHLSIYYDFKENQRLEKIKASCELYPSELYDEVLSRTVCGEKNLIIRTPKAWDINSGEDVFRALEGIRDYDKIVKTHFKKDAFKQETLNGINLEEMIKEIFPAMIDSMIDFVEN